VQAAFVSTAFLLAVGSVVAVTWAVFLTRLAEVADKALRDVPGLVATAQATGKDLVPYLLSMAGLTSSASQFTANQLYYKIASTLLERVQGVLQSEEGVAVLKIVRVNIWFVVVGIWLAIPIVFSLRMWRLGKLAYRVWDMAAEQLAVVEHWFDPASSSYRVGLLRDKHALRRLNPTWHPQEQLLVPQASGVSNESSSGGEAIRMWAAVVGSGRLKQADFFLVSLIYGQTYSATLQLSLLVIIATLVPTAVSAILIYQIVFTDGSGEGRMQAFYSFLTTFFLGTALPLIVRAIATLVMGRLAVDESQGLIRPVLFGSMLSANLLTGLTIGWVPVPKMCVSRAPPRVCWHLLCFCR
jgi:hypothetical protein